MHVGTLPGFPFLQGQYSTESSSSRYQKFLRLEYKGSARWSGRLWRQFLRCSSCTRTGFFLSCTGHWSLLLCLRNGYISGSLLFASCDGASLSCGLRRQRIWVLGLCCMYRSIRLCFALLCLVFLFSSC